MLWFTSDLHFGHKNILMFCSHTRPVSSVEEHDAAIIANWNKVVSPSDTVWILGDVALCNLSYANDCLGALNGELHLVQGNHDKGVVNSACRKRFASIQDYKRLSVEGKSLVLFHFPIWEWEGMQYGAYHLFGHLHGNPHGVPGRCVDIGLDGPLAAGTMAPVSLDRIVSYMEQLPIRKHG